ncbi:MAG: preprotein translocase subunit SecE [Firmicutes bacterium HGW-Firmicutes-11]|jgi:preprotein translocase subunit SecE|nr:MAG: preprotein translocase subunit SecE [Firmicutes bacterium HGW-Firmicutes-11]
MEKKPAVNTTPKKRLGIKDYFKGVRTEMKKVVWPSRKELVSYTSVVILTCVVFALAFWAFDSAFLALLKAVLNISI